MALTAEQLREHAVTIILNHAQDIGNLSISEHLEDLDMGDDAHNAATEAIDELINKATITISWPEDNPIVPDPTDRCPPDCTGNYPICPHA